MPVKNKKKAKDKNSKKIDWSKDRWKEMIVEQRKFLWNPEMVKQYVTWMGVRQGMTAVDVGCGLGYLGYTYWPYFGRKGKYIGIDQSPKLLKDAEIGAREWAKGGKYEFLTGDVFNLPFEDNFADWVMCQTLLMHLIRPKDALKEMIRILKPGGLFMCKEPDNLSGTIAYNFFPGLKISIEERLLLHKFELYCHEGRQKLGRGDDTIGNQIPHMLTELGMTEVESRMNDKVWLMEPPYDTKEQKHHLRQIEKSMTNRKEKLFRLKRIKEEFLAGGGNEKDYIKAKKIMDRQRASFRRRFKNGSFAACGGGFFYIIMARKPV